MHTPTPTNFRASRQLFCRTLIQLSPLSFDASNMTSIVDSTAHFAQRASEVGLSNAALGSLVRNGFDSLGKLAFSRGQRGMQIDAVTFHAYA